MILKNEQELDAFLNRDKLGRACLIEYELQKGYFIRGIAIKLSESMPNYKSGTIIIHWSDGDNTVADGLTGMKVLVDDIFDI